MLNLQEKVGSTLTSAGVDDVRWADGDGGTLYVVDDSGGPGGKGAIYGITGPFFPGEAFAAVSETGPPNSSSVVADGQTVDTLNLSSGVLTPLASGFVKASGMAWVPAGGGDETGAPGPQGPAGPTGPAGKSELLVCIAFGEHFSCSKQHLTGTDSIGETAVLERSGVRYATGRLARVSGRAELSLHATRSVTRGRYTLTLGRHTQTIALP